MEVLDEGGGVMWGRGLTAEEWMDAKAEWARVRGELEFVVNVPAGVAEATATIRWSCPADGGVRGCSVEPVGVYEDGSVFTWSNRPHGVVLIGGHGGNERVTTLRVEALPGTQLGLRIARSGSKDVDVTCEWSFA